MRTRRLKRQLPQVALALGGLALATLQLPSMMDNLARMDSFNRRVRDMGMTQQMSSLDGEYLQQRAKIADERYTSGCNVFPVVVVNGVPKYATVTNDRAVQNPDTHASYPAGSIICDPWGNAGVIKADPVGALTIQDVATTQNVGLIRQAMQARGLEVPKSNDTLGISQGRDK